MAIVNISPFLYATTHNPDRRNTGLTCLLFRIFFLKKNYSGSPNPPEVPNWNHQSAESPNLVGTENITNPWNFCTNKKGGKTGPKKPRTGRGIAHRYRSDRTGVQRGLNSFTWKARNRRGGWIWRQKRGGDRTEAFRAAAGVGGEGKLAILILYQCMEKWMMSIMQQEQRSPHAWRSTWCAHVEALAGNNQVINARWWRSLRSVR